MGRRFASVLGPLSLSVVLLRGIRWRAGAESTLVVATLCLVAFSLIGFVVGTIGQSVVEGSIRERLETEMAKRQKTGA